MRVTLRTNSAPILGLALALEVAAAYLQQFPPSELQTISRSEADADRGSFTQRCLGLLRPQLWKLQPTDKTDALALRLFYLAGQFAPVSIARTLLAQPPNLIRAARANKRASMKRWSATGTCLISQEPDGRPLLIACCGSFVRAQTL